MELGRLCRYSDIVKAFFSQIEDLKLTLWTTEPSIPCKIYSTETLTLIYMLKACKSLKVLTFFQRPCSMRFSEQNKRMRLFCSMLAYASLRSLRRLVIVGGIYPAMPLAMFVQARKTGTLLEEVEVRSQVDTVCHMKNGGGYVLKVLNEISYPLSVSTTVDELLDPSGEREMIHRKLGHISGSASLKKWLAEPVDSLRSSWQWRNGVVKL